MAVIKPISILILLQSFYSFLFSQEDIARRRKYLEDTYLINIGKHNSADRAVRGVTLKDSTWADWQKRTGELPPDFEKMPSMPFLPDPLVLNEGGKEIPIRTNEQWQQKRELIKKDFQYWISGTVPPPPKTFTSTILSDRMENGTHIQIIRMNFGPDNKARMTFELMIPEGSGPFPVYMTQGYHRGWAQLAVRRGYIGCVYAAADGADDTQAYQAIYPEYDFTALMRRAWGTSRVIDYLVTRKEVNNEQIAITGHSRNGKLSLWAAAFDDRISAVISSSSGTGGITPWRYSDPQYCAETLDWVCANQPHWFHPRLRFFFGREDKLPVDQNLLISLIAPRILLMHYSITESGLNPFANEQCYQSVKKIYRFLGAEENANLYLRMGEHAVSTRDLERCIDYLDIKFKRKQIPRENKLYFTYSFDAWASTHKADSIDGRKLKTVSLQMKYPDLSAYLSQKKIMLDNLQWLLGDEPSGVKPGKIVPVSQGDWIDNITGRPKVSGADVVHLGPYNAFGDHLRGIFYYPVDNAGKKITKSNGKIPAVIFLHEYAYTNGFARGYANFGARGNDRIFQALINKGFAILAIDMCGFGTRLEEGTYFYERFPGWSKMGKMIADVKACADALETFDFIDGKHIFLLGKAIGGGVALMATALDERIAGVAVVSAFSPLRSSNKQYESLRTYSHLHGLIPKLGYYAVNPREVPVDFGEIISCIAPRPALVIAPELDRYVDMEAIKKMMIPVRNVYLMHGKSDDLILRTPREINRMTDGMNVEVAEFFAGYLKY